MLLHVRSRVMVVLDAFKNAPLPLAIRRAAQGVFL